MKELNVFYRICPKPSLKSPILREDKLALTMTCLKSFLEAFKNVDYHINFILDSCPPIYKEKIWDLVQVEKTFFERSDMGDRGSLLRQYELARQLEDEEKVYFAEDDYLYLPDAGRKLVEALNVFDFVTLYDHPDYYHEPHLFQAQSVKIHANHHWVNRISTCHTFGTKAKLIKENRIMLTKYAPQDYQMWIEMTKKYQLFSPIPSLATHMVAWLMAPNINWIYEK